MDIERRSRIAASHRLQVPVLSGYRGEMTIAPVLAKRRLSWREPLDVLAPFADEPFAFALLSDESPEGCWSYIGRRPTEVLSDLASLRALLSEPRPRPSADGPPFEGGAVGLAAYELSAKLETTAPQGRRSPPWPDLVAGVYDQVVAFDHRAHEICVVARSHDDRAAESLVERLAFDVASSAVRSASSKPAGRFTGSPWDTDYPSAVAQLISAIGEGEIFQANIARGWEGRLPTDNTPFDLLSALHALSPAPFAAYLRLPNAALISCSPERFIAVSTAGEARTSPIKGTRARGNEPVEDSRLAAELSASVKDRAENLMIVDVMRNDLARVCAPGTVEVEAFCALQSFSNVHHLVSTVTGRLAKDEDALTLFASAFPPASVTGAPKLQAMQVIARHEPPRGPYCGSMFWAGFDGAFDSNVLIRTVALDQNERGWSWETRAGAGITADSDPQAEDAEAAQKALAVLAAFTT